LVGKSDRTCTAAGGAARERRIEKGERRFGDLRTSGRKRELASTGTGKKRVESRRFSDGEPGV
jgi:ABC-type phosphonate transport system ATPase subunit